MTRILRLFLSDEQIIHSIRIGDDSALSYLYEKNIRMIMKYIIQNNGTDANAREILQDALVVLWENARKDNFELKSKISTYLYSISRNKWMQELTRRKKHTSLEAVHNNPSSVPGADFTLEEEELSKIFKECISRLSPLCQHILTAFYYEERSMQEISKIYGLANEDVAKSKKYQCKKELERLVKKVLE